MKIRIKKLGKQILTAAMAGVLLVSVAGVESVFAAQEDVNEEAVLSPEKMEEETAEEIGMEEDSAEMNENLGGEGRCQRRDSRMRSGRTE